ncbi:19158_t:CDS:2 [Cetraspora pellucida]|uniref:19158_t:CDS:1 n=1 Tax=Cetraspora pellucida TaxID=1433469 RepID=A0A9N9DE28_9GLOM|nr:19158_t:CDS:2 [Cetraspora pellucida]
MQEIRELTPAGQIKRPPYNVIAEWIQRAWDVIDTQLIKCSFKCCGILVSSNGLEENLIFNYDQVEGYDQVKGYDQVEGYEVEGSKADELIFIDSLPQQHLLQQGLPQQHFLFQQDTSPQQYFSPQQGSSQQYFLPQQYFSSQQGSSQQYPPLQQSFTAQQCFLSQPYLPNQPNSLDVQEVEFEYYYTQNEVENFMNQWVE